MNPGQTALRVAPLAASDSFAADVISGLTKKPKRLPPKYFYDAVGSALFERITRLPEYYPTRSELELLHKHAAEIVSLFPPGAVLIEFGGGSSTNATPSTGARGA